jgi:hypothetical protein
MPSPENIEDLKRRKSLNVSQQVAVQRDMILREATSWRDNPVPPAIRSVFAQNDIDVDRGIFLDVSDREYEQNNACGIFVTQDGRFIEFDIEVSSDGKTLGEVSVFLDITNSLDICGQKPGFGATQSFLALDVLHEVNGL